KVICLFKMFYNTVINPTKVVILNQTKIETMELKATELRIGNYIFWDIPEKKNIIHVVDAILPNTYHTIPISLGNHKDYRAIPLTEKWLLDFGFEKETILSLHIRYVKNGFAIWHETVKNIFVLDNLM